MKWELSAEEVIKSTGGRWLRSPTQPLVFSGVGTDTRSNLSQQLFIALKGDNFDAHDFLEAAEAAGAGAALVHRAPDKDCKLPLIQVPDTLKALQDLAAYWRKKHKFFVLALTGSSGKTTTKEFCRQILSPYKRTHVSQGSFNNHWGVPLSVLGAAPDTEVIVQEMGMNHKGELTRLCEIAQPDVVLCTMVGTAHIGELGSQQAVAEAKEEIYIASPQARFIFNLDNEITRKMYEKYKGKKTDTITFSSFSSEAQIYMRSDQLQLHKLHLVGKVGSQAGEAWVPVFGRQNVVNLMAAGALSLAAGLTPEEIWKELPNCRTYWGRNQWVDLKNGAQVLFDAYNANPESMAALLRNLFEMDVKGKKVLLLGEMKELGFMASEAHKQLGQLAAQIQPDVIWFMGEHRQDFEAGVQAEKFSKTLFLSDTYEQVLAKKIGSMLNQDDVAVIKGSRAMKMEQVLESWKESPGLRSS